ncbi:MAG: hypothetical protein ACI8RL_001536 [Cyclobacteriaceae bacterium]
MRRINFFLKKCQLSFIAVFVILNMLFQCKQKEPASIRFQILTPQSSGITFTNQLKDNGDQNIIEYLYHYNGGGVGIGDFDNDGLEDIFLSGNQVPNKLYKNLGGLRFADVSLKAGVSDSSGWSTGVSVADVNLDGWLDIYVCQVGGYKSYKGQNKLYINLQDGSFKESASSYGLDFQGFSTQAAFLDYDKDGDLDMFLMNHAVHTPRSYQPSDERLVRDSLSGDYLYRNLAVEGEMRFEDASVEAGIIAASQGYGLGLVVSDVNLDGWPDIFVGNDFHEDDYLYINQKNGKFLEEMAGRLPHSSQYTMGVDIQDMNGDGQPDIFETDMMPADKVIRMKSGGEDSDKIKEVKARFGYHPQTARNNFHLNKGDAQFGDIALMTETYSSDWSWSVLLEDFDNNGLRDIFISNGIYKRPNDLDFINYLSNSNLGLFQGPQQDSLEEVLIKAMPTLRIANKMFAQVSPLNFEDMSASWGPAKGSYSGASAVADFDLDGDLDMIINNVNHEAWLVENLSTSIDSSHYLNVKLKTADTSIIFGSMVSVYSGQTKQVSQLNPVRGFMASSTHQIHFGLGSRSKVDSVIIRWPDGKVQMIKDIKTDHTLEVMYNTDRLTDEASLKEPLQEWNVVPSALSRYEDAYVDYNYDPLIPHSVSREGMGSAVADFDRNGQLEYVIGGASGFAPMFLTRDTSGVLASIRVSQLEADRQKEDVSIAVADFNTDGRLDMFVASGGNKSKEGDNSLSDRLYLGDGQLSFVKSNVLLPRTNASVAVAADFDADGDIDLFVGSRNVPGAYGRSPISYVLKNTGSGEFEFSPLEAGMVTDAAWTDYNGDGWLDLITVGEWEPITIWINEQGTLINQTKKFGLENTNGWYRALEIVDLNQDGKPDILAANLGSNALIQASLEEPASLYVGDFDGNGQSDPIVMHYVEGILSPMASKDMLVSQLPGLKKQFLSYTQYSKTEGIEDLLGKGFNQEEVIRKQAMEMRHLIVLSGDQSPKIYPMPFQAQMSPINDFWIGDINKDGHDDILTVAGMAGTTATYGLFDANPLSIYLGQSTAPFMKHQAFIPISQGLTLDQIIPIDTATFLLVPIEGNLQLLEKQ